MADSAATTTSTSDPAAVERAPLWRQWRFLVWAGLSAAFLAFLAFGSVNARFWRYDQLQLGQDFAIESKSIARIWAVQGDNLPQVSNQWLMQAAYYGAIVVFVVGVLLGMWLLLAEEREPSGPDADASR